MYELSGERSTPKTAAEAFAEQILETMAPQDGPLLPEGEQMVYGGPFGAGNVEPSIIEAFVQHNMPPVGGYPGPSIEGWAALGGQVQEASLHWSPDDCTQIGSVAIAQLTGLQPVQGEYAPAIQLRIRTTGVIERDAHDLEICVGAVDEHRKFVPQESVNYELQDPGQTPSVEAADSCVDLIVAARSLFTLADILPEVEVTRRTIQ